jgi:protein-L-isoaspartate(D-aspartate) O-methyltransferase
VGTGSGYQCAVLAHLARTVFSAEVVPELAARAAEVLFGVLHLENVHLRVGDGLRAWANVAPFDRVIVTAAPAEVPEILVAQLAAGGRMVVPVGGNPEVQMLKLIQRGDDGVTSEKDLLPVRFVPLIGERT